MWGLGLKNRTKKVLVEKFSYKVGRHQNDLLSKIAEEAKGQGLNEYDVAIMFMFVQMNSFLQHDDAANLFVKTQTRNIESVLSLAKSPLPDILKMLREVQAKSGEKREALGEGLASGLHPFTDAAEVPFLDSEGRILILRNKAHPFHVITDSGYIGANILQSPDFYNEQSAKFLLDREVGENRQITNWEIGYVAPWNEAEPSLEGGWNYLSLWGKANIVFNGKRTNKPWGYSKLLAEKAEEIVCVDKTRRSRKRLIEPRHPYTSIEQVPEKNEIGYIIILRSAITPEEFTYMHPNDFEKGWRFGTHRFGNPDIRDFEIGYYDPEIFVNRTDMMRNVEEKYNGDGTVKPFGFSQILLADCVSFKKMEEEWLGKP